MVFLVALLAISLLIIFLIGPNFISGDFVQETSDKAVIQSVSNSLNSFYKAKNAYPKDSDGLDALLCNTSGNSKENYCLSSFPRDHLGNKVKYRYPGFHNPSSFDVWVENKDYGMIGNW